MQKKTDIWIFASHNRHKTVEVANIFPFPIKNLWDIGLEEEIPENAFTIKENAFQKASFVYERYGVNCFADDTGLEVEALGGAPGVFSARYACLPDNFENEVIAHGKKGFTNVNTSEIEEAPSFNDNISRLLKKLQGLEPTKRKAAFVSIICLIVNGTPYYFEGRVQGEILLSPQGEQGFGYDPIFKPDGFSKSFAQLDLEEKNLISHRGKAVSALIEFVKESNQFRKRIESVS